MKLRHIFLLFSIIAGLAASLPTPAMAACEELRERIHETRNRLEELEGEKGPLHQELRRIPGADQKHKIEMRLEEIEHQQHELHRELGPLEEEFSECRKPDENGDNGGKNGLPQGIIIALIGAIGAVLAALIGLLKRR